MPSHVCLQLTIFLNNFFINRIPCQFRNNSNQGSLRCAFHTTQFILLLASVVCFLRNCLLTSFIFSMTLSIPTFLLSSFHQFGSYFYLPEIGHIASKPLVYIFSSKVYIIIYLNFCPHLVVWCLFSYFNNIA